MGSGLEGWRSYRSSDRGHRIVEIWIGGLVILVSAALASSSIYHWRTLPFLRCGRTVIWVGWRDILGTRYLVIWRRLKPNLGIDLSRISPSTTPFLSLDKHWRYGIGFGSHRTWSGLHIAMTSSQVLTMVEVVTIMDLVVGDFVQVGLDSIIPITTEPI